MECGNDCAPLGGHVLEDDVQFFIVADSKLDVSWGDGLLLVFVSALTRQIEDFHAEVLEGSSREDTSTGADSLSVSSLLDLSVASADWEDDSSSLGS